ncbi:MAG TPA: hypothetical protein VHV81_09445 [Steroidobacteraceae bacterium]|jgi:hypothetical protein|nr:hypothetical protein [Steroidobacteraceae bacterium]
MRTVSTFAGLLFVAVAQAAQPTGPYVGALSVPAQGEYATIDTKPSVAAIRTLAATAGHENDALVGSILQNAGAYNPPVLFALAALLYRQNDIDGAIFWLNAARVRATFDAQRCTDLSARSAVDTLVRQMPHELIAAQFRSRDALIKSIDLVIRWDDATPVAYDPRWVALHGANAIRRGIGVTSSDQPLMIPAKKWPALKKAVHDEVRSGLLQAFDQYQAATQGKPALPPSIPAVPNQPASHR